MAYAVQYSQNLAIRLPYPTQIARKFASHQPVVIDDPGILDVLAKYDFRFTGPVSELQVDKRNKSWIIETTQGEKILKRYSAKIKLEEIRYEHSIMNHLAKVDFPASHPTLTRDGSSFVEHEGRQFAIYEYLDGYAKFYDSIVIPSPINRFLSAEGKTLGALHHALKDFIPVGKSLNGSLSISSAEGRPISYYLSLLEQNFEESVSLLNQKTNAFMTSLCEQAEWIAEKFKDTERTLKDAVLKQQVIHGDFGPHNILIRSGHPVVVIDFEFARLDSRLVDLAAALTTSIRSRFGFSLHRSRQIIAGYQAANPLTEEELCLLPHVWQFYALRRITSSWAWFLKDGKQEHLSETNKRLAMLKWVDQNHQAISDLNWLR